jgi:hypothetical protein
MTFLICGIPVLTSFRAFRKVPTVKLVKQTFYGKRDFPQVLIVSLTIPKYPAPQGCHSITTSEVELPIKYCLDFVLPHLDL